MGLFIDEDGELRDDEVTVYPGGSKDFDETTGTYTNPIYAGEAPVDSGETPDFWESIGINPNTTMENWKSPSNEEIEKALQGDYNFAGLLKQYGKKAFDLFKTNGKFDPAKLAVLGAGLAAASKPNSGPAPTGYQGKIPKLTATSNMLTAPPVGRRPGSGGINYGGGVTYRDDKGNIVSSNEKTLEELRQAAINNPFNRGSTYEGGSGLGQTDLVTLLNALNPPTTPTTPIVGGGPVVGGGTVVGGGSTSSTGTKPTADQTARYNSINEFLRTNPSPAALAAAQKQYGVSDQELAAARNYGYQRYESIAKFLATNPSPEALAAAQKQYGVSDSELASARRYASVGAPPGTPGVDSSKVVVGGGGYSDFKPSGGTKAQGYSRDYSGDELTAIRGNFIKYRDNPQELMKLMDQYGVSVDDLALAYGGDRKGYQNIFLQAGADPSFGGMSDYKATANDKAYIDRMLTQPNPLGQGTLADMYKGQGIDPYTDPRVISQARSENERAARRADMYGGIASAPMDQIAPWQDPNWRAKQDAAQQAERERQQRMAAQDAASGVTVGGGIVSALPPDVNDWAQTQQGQAAGGINSVYDSINTFLAGNPSQEALQTAMKDFGVNEATLEAAKSYAAAPAAPAPAAPAAAAPVAVGPGPAPAATYAPTPEEIASWGYAKGGIAANGFVVPADVVSHFGNGSSEAGLKLLAQKIGATPIKGDGDGMSDSIKTKIDGVQEARVANDEAYVSPEMVKKLGNGSPEKGARKLYAMMDQVRKARTGTTKQGKQIDPNKYMPGGSVQRYQTGGTTTTPAKPVGATGSSESLSNWAGDYVTNMLGQGQALANKPYEAYTGPLTAGSSTLQNQAFNMAGNLQTPGSIAQAAGTAGGIANLAANLRYTPQTTSFLGDQNRSGIDVAPSYFMSNPGNMSTPDYFTGPRGDKTGGSRYVPAPGIRLRHDGDPGPGGGYDEAGNRIRYGGGPPGGPDSGFPMQYRPEPAPPVSAGPGAMPPPDVMQQIEQQQQPQQQQPQQSGGIAQQYMNPYLESALRPQMAEMQRAADIARMSDAARLTQAGAFGGSRQAIMESEGRRNLLDKQSEALGQGYATAYDKAMAQFNADQNRRAQEAQFGATFGLQGLQTGLQGAQTQAQAGALQSQSDINNLRATLEAGGVQRGIESEGIAADKAQFEEARLNPYKMVQFQQSLLSGLPIAAQSYSIPGQSNLQQFASGAGTLQGLLKSLGYKFD